MDRNRRLKYRSVFLALYKIERLLSLNYPNSAKKQENSRESFMFF